MKEKAIILVVVLLLTSIILPTVDADWDVEVISDSFTNTSGASSSELTELHEEGQTITCSLTKMTKIAIRMRRYGSGTGNIYVFMLAGTPSSSTILGSATRSVSSLSTSWTYSEFNFADFEVSHDQQISFRVGLFDDQPGSDYVMVTKNSDGYSGGTRYYSDDEGYSWTQVTGEDIHFRLYGLDGTPIIPSSSPDPMGNAYLNVPVSMQINGWDPDEDDTIQFKVAWTDGSYSSWYTMTHDDGFSGDPPRQKWHASAGDSGTSHTYASAFSGYIRVINRDSYGVESIRHSVFINAYDHVPALSGGSVSPSSGDSDTEFTFGVFYNDGDHQDPGRDRLYYRRDGGSWYYYDMSYYSGSTYYGWYRKVQSFPDGNYEFYFDFHDGTVGHTVYYPSGGSTNPLSFIVSTNNPPDAFSASAITYTPSTFFRNQEVTFHASTTDQDGDQIKYGFDWDTDGTIDDWTGYYTSGSDCTQTQTYTTEESPAGCLPGTITVTADDGNGGTYGPVAKTINLFNQDPSNDEIGGTTVVGLDIEYTWNIVVDDPEDDDMEVTWNWGDGTADDVSAWESDGTDVTQAHTYTIPPYGDTYTIQATIKDEYYACMGGQGITQLYLAVTIYSEPTPPTSITATAYNERVKLKWSIPQDNGGDPPTVYGIKYWNNSLLESTASFVYEIPWENASIYDNTGHNITSLDNDWEYAFRMSCNNTYGMSAWSDPVYATPGHTPPSTPVMQGLAEYSTQTVTVSWSPSTFYDGATIDHYNISYSTDNIAYTNLDDTTQTSYQATGLTNGETYYFKVNCTDSDGGVSQTSGYSWTFIDSVNPTEAILNDLPDITYDTSIIVSWAESTDDDSGINSYNIWEDDSNRFDNPLSNVFVDDGITEYTFSSNHVRGKTYYYKIQAYDNAGNVGGWNGPIQTTIKSNDSVGTEYSKITEIWFDKNNIVINQPVTITVTVEDKYIIPTGFVTYLEEGSLSEVTMRISGTGEGYYKYNGIWTPTISGASGFKIKVINQNDASNQVTIPLTVLSTNVSQLVPTVLLFENTDEDVMVATFSETELNTSAYQDIFDVYHVAFGTNPDTMIDIDLTKLELSLKIAYWFGFIRVSFLDDYRMNCMVHGATKPKNYIIRRSDATVDGYNDWWSKIKNVFSEPRFILISESSTELKLSSIEDEILAKYNSP